MRTFDYEALANKKWDMDIVKLVAKIHECKGRQDLFVRQKPAELERLVEITSTIVGVDISTSDVMMIATSIAFRKDG